MFSKNILVAIFTILVVALSFYSVYLTFNSPQIKAMREVVSGANFLETKVRQLLNDPNASLNDFGTLFNSTNLDEIKSKVSEFGTDVKEGFENFLNKLKAEAEAVATSQPAQRLLNLIPRH